MFVHGGEARVALRIAATPLHRRVYKQAAGPGSLHPPLAAALVRLAGPAGVLADPFCGNGSITIEAAFAGPAARILAGDIDPARLANAHGNSTRAGSESLLTRMDAGLPPWAAGVVGAVVTNPPWGVGVDARGVLTATMGSFWSELKRVLTPDGRACLVADAGLDVPGLLPGFGFQAGLATRVRLAGRVAHVVLSAPADPGMPSATGPSRRVAPPGHRCRSGHRRRILSPGTIVPPTASKGSDAMPGGRVRLLTTVSPIAADSDASEDGGETSGR